MPKTSDELERANKLIELDAARENRRFEIQMFWQRANYFLVLNTALAIGTFSVKSPSVALLTSVFGIFCSYLWFKTNLGARFWQVFWETEVFELSQAFNMKAFSMTDKEIVEQMKTSPMLKSSTSESFLRRWIDKQVLKKPSVSYNMILLSFGALVVWLSVFFSGLVTFLMKYCSC